MTMKTVAEVLSLFPAHVDGQIVPVAVFGGTIVNLGDVFVESLSSGRAYIALGQPGFNLPANNRAGYASVTAAANASRRVSLKSQQRALSNFVATLGK